MNRAHLCLFCDKYLDLVSEDTNSAKTYQPYSGGEVCFSFCYGSSEFDECVGLTNFRAILCDECAKKYIDKMNKTRTHPPFIEDTE